MIVLYIKTLSDMWHISNLRKNMIFLSTLDLYSFKYYGEGRVLKVSKGAPIVFKNRLSHGLCLLQDSIVVGAVLVTSLDLNSNNTHL